MILVFCFFSFNLFRNSSLFFSIRIRNRETCGSYRTDDRRKNPSKVVASWVPVWGLSFCIVLLLQDPPTPSVRRYYTEVNRLQRNIKLKRSVRRFYLNNTFTQTEWILLTFCNYLCLIVYTNFDFWYFWANYLKTTYTKVKVRELIMYVFEK